MTTKRDAIKISAVGDLGLIGKISEYMDKKGPDYPFRHVVRELNTADIVFGNLEMPFCDDATSNLRCYQSKEFFHTLQAAKSLRSAGFSILSLANNHIMECGREGLEKTVEVLSMNSIKFVGAGKNLKESRKPAIFDVHETKIGFLAYTTKSKDSASFSNAGSAPIEIELIIDDVINLKKQCDFVIVSLHFGFMYIEIPSPDDVKLCHKIIDNGADVILGHHPHVLQGIERYKNGLICYSLGEFVFDRMAGVRFVKLGSENRRESLILNLYLKKKQPIQYDLVPTFLSDNYQVEIQTGEPGLRILKKIDRLSARIASTEDFYEEAGANLVSYEISGLFYHIKRRNFSYLLLKARNIRLKHLKIFLGFLKRVSKKAL